MLLWCIKAAIVSFIIILVIHSLIGFFKNTLTVPKFKDLVDVPNKRYQSMMDKIYETPPPQRTDDDDSMKKELKDYLRTQLGETFSTR